jgi:hypothetical protein
VFLRVYITKYMLRHARAPLPSAAAEWYPLRPSHYRRFPFDPGFRAQRLCRHMLNVLASVPIFLDSHEVEGSSRRGRGEGGGGGTARACVCGGGEHGWQLVDWKAGKCSCGGCG